MADKKKYYKLDEIGIVGKQEKLTPAARQQRMKKTGEIFRKVRASSHTKSRQLQKAS